MTLVTTLGNSTSQLYCFADGPTMSGRGEHIVSIRPLGYSRKIEQDLDAPVLYNMDRMKASLSSGEISVPKGLTREARRQFVRGQLSNGISG
jgi:hypothetical protein